MAVTKIHINVTGTYSAIKFLPSGNMELVFEIPFRQKSDLLRGIDEITAAGLPELSIKAEKKRKKRSLDANDYLWVLCTKIAEKLQDGKTMVTKEEVYRKHIEAVGKFDPLAIHEDAVERFSQVWQRNGTGAMPLAEIMTQHKYLGLPSFESVSRTRRKLQARYPELAGSRPVQKMRATGEKAYRRYAKE